MESRKEYIKRDKFDFELGYFVKSPCIKCPHKDDMPKCHSNCETLQSVQSYIASGVSCFKG